MWKGFLRRVIVAILCVSMLYQLLPSLTSGARRIKRVPAVKTALEFCGLSKSWTYKKIIKLIKPVGTYLSTSIIKPVGTYLSTSSTTSKGHPPTVKWRPRVRLKRRSRKPQGYQGRSALRSYTYRAIPKRPSNKWKNFARLICLLSVSFVSASQTARDTMMFDSDSVPIRIDNCATKSIWRDKGDFVGPLKRCHARVKGIGGIKDIIYSGTLRLRIDDDNGVAHEKDIKGVYYMPTLSCNILSPQHWAQSAKDNYPLPRGTWCGTYEDAVILHWDQREFRRTLLLDQDGANVGTIYTSPSIERFDKYCNTADVDNDPVCYDAHSHDDAPMAATPHEVTPDDEEGGDGSVNSDQDSSHSDHSQCTTECTDDQHQRSSPVNFDTDTSEEEPTCDEDQERPMEENDSTRLFQQWHQRLGHVSPRTIQTLAKAGVLPKKLSTCRVPMCPSCIFGKASRTPWRTRRKKKDKQPTIKITKPGQCVSVDQLESSTTGFIAQLKGNLTRRRYRVATAFVDHFSGLSYVHPQTSTNAKETLEAKAAFERYCESFGVQVRHYQCDNGIFAGNEFRAACDAQQQGLSFCGVNAHFQNGRAEKRIRDLQDSARTQLIHAQRRWPSAVNSHLWPYALRIANDMRNLTPNAKTGKVPFCQFAGTTVAPDLRHYHHAFCPVYVLDNRLQQQKKIDKWDERSRVGLYIGPSPQHARNVALVLNLQTGLASPQFHLKFDSTFETVKGDYSPPKSLWQTKAMFHLDKLPKGDKRSTAKQPPLHSVYDQTPPGTGATGNPEGERAIPEGAPTPPEGAPTPPEGAPTPAEGATFPRAPPLIDYSDQVDVDDGFNNEDGFEDINDGEHDDDNHVSFSDDAPTEPRRSPRLAALAQPSPEPRRSARIKALEESKKAEDVLYVSMMQEIAPGYIAYEALSTAHRHESNEIDRACPIQFARDNAYAFKASSDPDVFTYKEAMEQPDRKEFVKAMAKEMDSHNKAGHWEVVNRSDIPKKYRVVPAVWAMRRKRRIDTREVYKWKSRATYGGHRQVKDVDYWETYAPVANWSSIRLLLAMTAINKWETRQIDFVLAYCQADAEHPNMYMAVPKGMEMDGGSENFALRLVKNLFGQKQAGRVWNKHLVKGLLDIGFVQSTIDECVFYHGGVIMALYTDDVIATAADPKELDKVVALMDDKFNITSQGKVEDFLGVKIDNQENGNIHFTQPQLIDQILEDLGLTQDNVAVKDTPAVSNQTLLRHETSAKFDESWKYRSVIGKMNFLEKSTRPDISVAVHQCARFMEDPKVEHGEAVKRIGRYLKGTRDGGLIYKPTNDSFDCYVDASFAGEWNPATAHADRSTARSRAGHVIMYCGCPLVWASKLQSEIALSTTESELIGLSQALREAIPLMRLVQEFKDNGHDMKALQPNVHCRAFEDNSGALAIGSVIKYRPRTRHYCTKLWHFKDYVESKQISLHKIDTKDQLADCFTKSLAVVLFRKFRLAIMGW
jgi:hypothetical protein